MILSGCLFFVLPASNKANAIPSFGKASWLL